MSKADRIPDAWPAQMSDVLAARYCDYSLSQFHAMVAADKIPAGTSVPGTKMVRWHRSTLDRVVDEIHGIDADETDGAASGDNNEWLQRIRNGPQTSLPEQDQGSREGILVLSPRGRKRAIGGRAG